METTSGSSTRIGRFVASARGRATSTPWWSMGAAIMKMISSTSITSTSGVTLMSASTGSSSFPPKPPPPPRLNAMASPPRFLGEVPLGQVEELEGEVLEAAAEDADPVREVVVADERRDGGGQAGGRVDERLGDAGRHGHDRGRAGHADVAEGVHDAPDRAEKADEGCRGGGGGEQRDPAGEVLHLDARRPGERPLEGRER